MVVVVMVMMEMQMWIGICKFFLDILTVDGCWGWCCSKGRFKCYCTHTLTVGCSFVRRVHNLAISFRPKRWKVFLV